MKKSASNTEKFFVGVGIVTVFSGIFLVFEGDYIIGISGSIVGIGLVLMNLKQLKEKRSQQDP
ncbi:MAG: hypothetical protein AAFN92_04010 [Bacteroidota bacterium]